ncbi:MAG: FUSC family protein [Alphaproteobacteria bacterium]|nr:FUSC family protein [Alphaproteobacteria bacterium]
MDELVAFEGLLGSLWAELKDIGPTGPRARQATITALSVSISVTLALLGHMDMPWWAGISGFMSVQATRPGSVQRVILRIAGTIAGAAAALAIMPFVAHDHVAGSLFLFTVAALGMLGSLVSPHAYAWLFFAITANLIVLMSIDDPTAIFHSALYRVGEVTMGSLSALLVVTILASDTPPAPAPPPPGWSDLLGARWPAVLHAIRTGITVMLLPWAWSWFDLPGLSQMAITVAAVMAVPVLGDHPLENGRLIAGRAVQRMLGCALGGLMALVALSLSPSEFLPWIVLLVTGVWFGSYVQSSTRGVGYVGTQASIVWIMMIVQGLGPPDSLLPGLDRFAGILAGLAILLVVSLLLWPAEPTPASATE